MANNINIDHDWLFQKFHHNSSNHIKLYRNTKLTRSIIKVANFVYIDCERQWSHNLRSRQCHITLIVRWALFYIDSFMTRALSSRSIAISLMCAPTGTKLRWCIQLWSDVNMDSQRYHSRQITKLIITGALVLYSYGSVSNAILHTCELYIDIHCSSCETQNLVSYAPNYSNFDCGCRLKVVLE